MMHTQYYTVSERAITQRTTLPGLGVQKLWAAVIVDRDKSRGAVSWSKTMGSYAA